MRTRSRSSGRHQPSHNEMSGVSTRSDVRAAQMHTYAQGSPLQFSPNPTAAATEVSVRKAGEVGDLDPRPARRRSACSACDELGWNRGAPAEGSSTTLTPTC